MTQKNIPFVLEKLWWTHGPSHCFNENPEHQPRDEGRTPYSGQTDKFFALEHYCYKGEYLTTGLFDINISLK